jgi:hypothetical protein
MLSLFVAQYTSVNILKYYTLRFYFPYLTSLAQPVTILVYGPARYLH